jgi:hypothetical protein
MAGSGEEGDGVLGVVVVYILRTGVVTALRV